MKFIVSKFNFQSTISSYILEVDGPFQQKQQIRCVSNEGIFLTCLKNLGNQRNCLLNTNKKRHKNVTNAPKGIGLA